MSKFPAGENTGVPFLKGKKKGGDHSMPKLLREDVHDCRQRGGEENPKRVAIEERKKRGGQRQSEAADTVT